MTVTIYTFESADGREDTYTTSDCTRAKCHAECQSLRCFANEFEYSDRELAWDFTKQETDA